MDMEIVTYTVLIVIAFFASVYPLYYKVGKLEQKVNTLCRLVNPENPKKKEKKK